MQGDALLSCCGAVAGGATGAAGKHVMLRGNGCNCGAVERRTSRRSGVTILTAHCCPGLTSGNRRGHCRQG